MQGNSYDLGEKSHFRLVYSIFLHWQLLFIKGQELLWWWENGKAGGGSGKWWTLEGFLKIKSEASWPFWVILEISCCPFPLSIQPYLIILHFPQSCLTDIAFFTNWRHDPLPGKKSQLALLWDSLYFNGLDPNPQSLRCACVHHKGIINASASISVSLTFLWWLLGALSYWEKYVGWGGRVSTSFRFLMWISVFLNIFHISFFKQPAFKFILFYVFRSIHFYFPMFLFV